MSVPPPVDYGSLRDAPPAVGAAIGKAACLVAALATIVPCVSFVEMLRVPIGTEIRPMTQAMSMIVCGTIAVLLVPSLAIVAMAVAKARREPRTRWPLFAFLAAVVAAVLPTALFLMILSARRLTLAP